jgi:hypothetical protein
LDCAGWEPHAELCFAAAIVADKDDGVIGCGRCWIGRFHKAHAIVIVPVADIDLVGPRGAIDVDIVTDDDISGAGRNRIPGLVTDSDVVCARVVGGGRVTAAQGATSEGGVGIGNKPFKGLSSNCRAIVSGCVTPKRCVSNCGVVFARSGVYARDVSNPGVAAASGNGNQT